MINEILSEIKEAEAAAKALEEEALANAKKMNMDADKQAEEMKAQAKADAKAERLAVIASAEEEADKNYDRILEIGGKEAEKLIADTDVTSAGQKITSLFVKKWARQ